MIHVAHSVTAKLIIRRQQMKKGAAGLCMALGCAVILSSGCAKSGRVKSDAPVGSVATVADKQQARRGTTSNQPVKPDTGKERSAKLAEVKDITEQVTLEPIPNAAELKAALHTIYFDFDSYALSQDARNSLVRNAELLKIDTSDSIRIEGNCDERGSDEYNLALGEKRANAAMQYLVTMGVPASRLSVISYGKEKPAVISHDEAAWAKNRRDDFVISSK